MTISKDRPAGPCVCATLRRASRSVSRYFDNVLRPSGLKATQFELLSEIRDRREATNAELTRALLTDQTTLTRNVALLERDGLLEVSERADAREKAIRLTVKGKKKLAEARPFWTSAQREMLEHFEGEQWQRLRKQLQSVADSASRNLHEV